jgi:hypothetical protein
MRAVWIELMFTAARLPLRNEPANPVVAVPNVCSVTLACEGMMLQVERSRGASDVGEDFEVGHLLTYTKTRAKQCQRYR